MSQRVLLLCQLEYAIEHNIFQISITIARSTSSNLTPINSLINLATNTTLLEADPEIASTTANVEHLLTSLSTQSNTEKDHGGYLNFYYIDTLPGAVGTSYYYTIRLRGNATAGKTLNIRNCYLSVLNI